jgi:UDP-N-acetylglucosamine 2-epimerase (non-hydrolysing)
MVIYHQKTEFLRLACVVGARPNFMKMAPLLRALKRYNNVRVTLIHTGQHYDEDLSSVFFDELGMRKPDICLDVGSGKHGEQTARALERLESVLESGPSNDGTFDRLVVVGDVNSTMAAALAAVKLKIPVAHIEAGLRSFDRSMPEEINRIVTDAVADMLFVSEPAGVENLRREGHPPNHVFLTGNVMIDTLKWFLPKAIARNTSSQYGFDSGKYGVVTLHRSENVDSFESLSHLLDALEQTSRELPLLFPIHPRTKNRLETWGLTEWLDRTKDIIQLPPLGYLDLLSLIAQSKVILTDSGGLQEEATALGIPCLTLRSNTERPVTVEEGTNTLVGHDPEKLRDAFQAVLNGSYKQGHCPDLWDGKAAERIATILADSLLPSVAAHSLSKKHPYRKKTLKTMAVGISDTSHAKQTTKIRHT